MIKQDLLNDMNQIELDSKQKRIEISIYIIIQAILFMISLIAPLISINLTECRSPFMNGDSLVIYNWFRNCKVIPGISFVTIMHIISVYFLIVRNDIFKNQAFIENFILFDSSIKNDLVEFQLEKFVPNRLWRILVFILNFSVSVALYNLIFNILYPPFLP